MGNYHHKRLKVNYNYFLVMEKGKFPSMAPSRHQGSVAVFYHDSPLFKVDAHQHFFPNVVSFQLVWGGGAL